MKMRFIVVAVFVFGVVDLALAKDQFYRWTDENGTVHYSATPPDQGQATAVDVQTKKAEKLDAATAATEPVEPEPATDDAMKKMLAMEAQLCKRARESLRVLEEGRSIKTVSTSTGESHPLVGADREKAKAQAVAQVDQFCSPPAVATREE